jgi:hypothetical protein
VKKMMHRKPWFLNSSGEKFYSRAAMPINFLRDPKNPGGDI